MDTQRTETVDGKFRVGGGATVHYYADSHACTVISISKSGKSMIIQRDNAKLLNGTGSDAPDKLTFTPGGFVGHVEGKQRYEYTTDYNGIIYPVRLNKKGQWKHDRICTVTAGRDEYYDFNY